MRRSYAQAQSRLTAGSRYREMLLAGLPVSEQRMELAGIPTAVLEGGEGPPIVLLHGAGEFAATWMRVIPDLVKAHRVIAPDLPGHGHSELPDGPLDAGKVQSWLGELIERTCPSPPILAGHLLGGAVALRFAVDHGERIDCLMLVDSFGLAPLRPAARFTLAMVAFVALPSQRTQEGLFRRCFVDLDGVREEMGATWDPLAAYALDRARTPNLKAALRGMMPQIGLPAIPAADLARIDVPTTLIWGRHDLQVRLGIAEEASERYGWPLHIIENAADDPAFEQPETFLKEMYIALERHHLRRNPTEEEAR
jgi:pimeloyl-ACP methyl ester carboxylesterase